MKVHPKGFLGYLKLDQTYSLLSGREISLTLEFFKALDIRGEMVLDDVQFLVFVQTVTDLSKSKTYKLFDMLDVDNSGLMDFDEFYLLLCILIAVRDKQEKQFILRHSRTVFDILDEDGSSNISAVEFENFGFLFNFDGNALKQIFREFNISGDHKLDYHEFKMFAVACIDRQTVIGHKTKKKSDSDYDQDKSKKKSDNDYDQDRGLCALQ